MAGKSKSARLSAANIETEIRNVARRFAHIPVADIVALLRERGIAANPDFVAACAAPYRKE